MAEFSWTTDQIDAAFRAIMGDGWEDSRVISSDEDVDLAPGVYEVRAADAEVSIRIGRKGSAITTDTNDIPTEGVYLAPGDAFRWSQRTRGSVRVEPGSGAKATIIRRYTG